MISDVPRLRVLVAIDVSTALVTSMNRRGTHFRWRLSSAGDNERLAARW